MDEEQIVYLKTSELRNNPNNPRKNDEAVDTVVKSIKKYGFRNPLIVDENGIVWCGNTRLKASKKMGLKVVPCIVVKDLTEKEMTELALLDNKTNEIAEWDDDALADILATTDFSDFDELDWGIEAVEDVLEEETEVVEDDFDVETAISEEPKAKLGDIYQLGEHRLMCGDSTDKYDVEKLMDNKKGKCLFTSPPYNMNGGLYENYTDNLESKNYIDFNMSVVNTWLKYLQGYLFWNISYNKNSRWEFIEILYKIVKETGMRFLELIVWDKGHGIPIISKEMLTRQYEDILLVGNEENVSEDMELYYLGSTEKRGYFNKKKGKGITNYWRITTGDTQLDNHKACFPIKLPAKAIELTTDKNDIVLEPFGGSGSTLIACEQLNRRCFTMELDPKYVDVIIKRWEEFTGKKAIKISALFNNTKAIKVVSDNLYKKQYKENVE